MSLGGTRETKKPQHNWELQFNKGRHKSWSSYGCFFNLSSGISQLWRIRPETLTWQTTCNGQNRFHFADMCDPLPLLKEGKEEQSNHCRSRTHLFLVFLVYSQSWFLSNEVKLLHPEGTLPVFITPTILSFCILHTNKSWALLHPLNTLFLQNAH